MTNNNDQKMIEEFAVKSAAIDLILRGLEPHNAIGVLLGVLGARMRNYDDKTILGVGRDVLTCARRASEFDAFTKADSVAISEAFTAAIKKSKPA